MITFMQMESHYIRKEWQVYGLLLVCSFGIYFVYLHSIFFQLNSSLSSITLDSIKNYYTFVYHASRDAKFFEFSGMNYPLGEHSVYTDSQPLISSLLYYLPVPSDYLIGVLHALLFGSFIIAPLFLYPILLRLQLNKLSAFISALAIAVLSPQFLKINAGHHALAYGSIFPIVILLILRVAEKTNWQRLTLLASYNTLVFFIHPYLGFCLSVFTFLSLLFYLKWSKVIWSSFSTYALLFFTSLFPLAFFKVVMRFSDMHVNRPAEPYGLEVMVENLDSILAPEFGPFQSFLQTLFPNRTQHFEGHSYIGFFVILMSLTAFTLLLIYRKKLKLPSLAFPLFFSGLALLLIAFGYHHKVMRLFHLKSEALNQFRAVCRFAWVFYFTLPLFVLSVLHQFFTLRFSTTRSTQLGITLSALYLLFNLMETGPLLHFNEAAFWKFRNFFNSKLLSDQEKGVLQKLQAHPTQAILTLPLIHGGSELYDRNGSSNTMAPAMLYSYHSGLPILGIMASRGSRTETEDMIQVYNSYKRDKNLRSKFRSDDFFVIRSLDPLMPDEERLKSHVDYFFRSDSLDFGFISKQKLLTPKKQSEAICLMAGDTSQLRKEMVYYIPSLPRKPFSAANMVDYETICTIDSNVITSGQFIVSMHYYFEPLSFRNLALDLIVTETKNGTTVWKDLIPIRKLSGFYAGYGVFENFVELQHGARYEFILKGPESCMYHLSNFLVRAAQHDVYNVTAAGDTLYNNYLP